MMMARRFYEQQFEEGYNAFHYNIMVCPYKKGTMMAKEWERGFNYAFQENTSVNYA